MFTFSKTSWHYRMASFTGYGNESNLCPYVRRVALGTLIFTFMVSLIGLVAASTIMGLIGLVQGFYPELSIVVHVVNGVTIALLFIAFLKWVGDRYSDLKDHFKRKRSMKVEASLRAKYGKDWANLCTFDEWRAYVRGRSLEEPVTKEPSLVRAYLSAMHDKLCPSISFKEPLDPNAV